MGASGSTDNSSTSRRRRSSDAASFRSVAAGTSTLPAAVAAARHHESPYEAAPARQHDKEELIRKLLRRHQRLVLLQQQKQQQLQLVQLQKHQERVLAQQLLQMGSLTLKERKQQQAALSERHAQQRQTVFKRQHEQQKMLRQQQREEKLAYRLQNMQQPRILNTQLPSSNISCTQGRARCSSCSSYHQSSGSIGSPLTPSAAVYHMRARSGNYSHVYSAARHYDPSKTQLHALCDSVNRRCRSHSPRRDGKHVNRQNRTCGSYKVGSNNGGSNNRKRTNSSSRSSSHSDGSTSVHDDRVAASDVKESRKKRACVQRHKTSNLVIVVESSEEEETPRKNSIPCASSAPPSTSAASTAVAAAAAASIVAAAASTAVAAAPTAAAGSPAAAAQACFKATAVPTRATMKTAALTSTTSTAAAASAARAKASTATGKASIAASEDSTLTPEASAATAESAVAANAPAAAHDGVVSRGEVVVEAAAAVDKLVIAPTGLATREDGVLLEAAANVSGGLLNVFPSSDEKAAIRGAAMQVAGRDSGVAVDSTLAQRAIAASRSSKDEESSLTSHSLMSLHKRRGSSSNSSSESCASMRGTQQFGRKKHKKRRSNSTSTHKGRSGTECSVERRSAVSDSSLPCRAVDECSVFFILGALLLQPVSVDALQKHAATHSQGQGRQQHQQRTVKDTKERESQQQQQRKTQSRASQASSHSVASVYSYETYFCCCCGCSSSSSLCTSQGTPLSGEAPGNATCRGQLLSSEGLLHHDTGDARTPQNIDTFSTSSMHILSRSHSLSAAAVNVFPVLAASSYCFARRKAAGSKGGVFTPAANNNAASLVSSALSEKSCNVAPGDVIADAVGCNPEGSAWAPKDVAGCCLGTKSALAFVAAHSDRCCAGIKQSSQQLKCCSSLLFLHVEADRMLLLLQQRMCCCCVCPGDSCGNASERSSPSACCCGTRTSCIGPATAVAVSASPAAGANNATVAEQTFQSLNSSHRVCKCSGRRCSSHLVSDAQTCCVHECPEMLPALFAGAADARVASAPRESAAGEHPVTAAARSPGGATSMLFCTTDAGNGAAATDAGNGAAARVSNGTTTAAAAVWPGAYGGRAWVSSNGGGGGGASTRLADALHSSTTGAGSAAVGATSGVAGATIATSRAHRQASSCEHLGKTIMLKQLRVQDLREVHAAILSAVPRRNSRGRHSDSSCCCSSRDSRSGSSRSGSSSSTCSRSSIGSDVSDNSSIIYSNSTIHRSGSSRSRDGGSTGESSNKSRLRRLRTTISGCNNSNTQHRNLSSRSSEEAEASRCTRREDRKKSSRRSANGRCIGSERCSGECGGSTAISTSRTGSSTSSSTDSAKSITGGKKKVCDSNEAAQKAGGGSCIITSGDDRVGSDWFCPRLAGSSCSSGDFHTSPPISASHNFCAAVRPTADGTLYRHYGNSSTRHHCTCRLRSKGDSSTKCQRRDADDRCALNSSSRKDLRTSSQNEPMNFRLESLKESSNSTSGGTNTVQKQCFAATTSSVCGELASKEHRMRLSTADDNTAEAAAAACRRNRTETKLQRRLRKLQQLKLHDQKQEQQHRVKPKRLQKQYKQQHEAEHQRRQNYHYYRGLLAESRLQRLRRRHSPSPKLHALTRKRQQLLKQYRHKKELQRQQPEHRHQAKQRHDGDHPRRSETQCQHQRGRGSRGELLEVSEDDVLVVLDEDEDDAGACDSNSKRSRGSSKSEAGSATEIHNLSAAHVPHFKDAAAVSSCFPSDGVPVSAAASAPNTSTVSSGRANASGRASLGASSTPGHAAASPPFSAAAAAAIVTRVAPTSGTAAAHLKHREYVAHTLSPASSSSSSNSVSSDKSFSSSSLLGESGRALVCGISESSRREVLERLSRKRDKEDITPGSSDWWSKEPQVWDTHSKQSNPDYNSRSGEGKRCGFHRIRSRSTLDPLLRRRRNTGTLCSTNDLTGSSRSSSSSSGSRSQSGSSSNSSSPEATEKKGTSSTNTGGNSRHKGRSSAHDDRNSNSSTNGMGPGPTTATAVSSPTKSLSDSAGRSGTATGSCRGNNDSYHMSGFNSTSPKDSEEVQNRQSNIMRGNFVDMKAEADMRLSSSVATVSCRCSGNRQARGATPATYSSTTSCGDSSRLGIAAAATPTSFPSTNASASRIGYRVASRHCESAAAVSAGEPAEAAAASTAVLSSPPLRSVLSTFSSNAVRESSTPEQLQHCPSQLQKGPQDLQSQQQEGGVHKERSERQQQSQNQQPSEGHPSNNMEARVAALQETKQKKKYGHSHPEDSRYSKKYQRILQAMHPHVTCGELDSLAVSVGCGWKNELVQEGEKGTPWQQQKHTGKKHQPHKRRNTRNTIRAEQLHALLLFFDWTPRTTSTVQSSLNAGSSSSSCATSTLSGEDRSNATINIDGLSVCKSASSCSTGGRLHSSSSCCSRVDCSCSSSSSKGGSLHSISSRRGDCANNSGRSSTSSSCLGSDASTHTLRPLRESVCGVRHSHSDDNPQRAALLLIVGPLLEDFASAGQPCSKLSDCFDQRPGQFYQQPKQQQQQHDKQQQQQNQQQKQRRQQQQHGQQNNWERLMQHVESQQQASHRQQRPQEKEKQQPKKEEEDDGKRRELQQHMDCRDKPQIRQQFRDTNGRQKEQKQLQHSLRRPSGPLPKPSEQLQRLEMRQHRRDRHKLRQLQQQDDQEQSPQATEQQQQQQLGKLMLLKEQQEGNHHQQTQASDNSRREQVVIQQQILTPFRVKDSVAKLHPTECLTHAVDEQVAVIVKRTKLPSATIPHHELETASALAASSTTGTVTRVAEPTLPKTSTAAQGPSRVSSEQVRSLLPAIATAGAAKAGAAIAGAATAGAATRGSTSGVATAGVATAEEAPAATATAKDRMTPAASLCTAVTYACNRRFSEEVKTVITPFHSDRANVQPSVVDLLFPKSPADEAAERIWASAAAASMRLQKQLRAAMERFCAVNADPAANIKPGPAVTSTPSASTHVPSHAISLTLPIGALPSCPSRTATSGVSLTATAGAPAATEAAHSLRSLGASADAEAPSLAATIEAEQSVAVAMGRAAGIAAVSGYSGSCTQNKRCTAGMVAESICKEEGLPVAATEATVAPCCAAIAATVASTVCSGWPSQGQASSHRPATAAACASKRCEHPQDGVAECCGATAPSCDPAPATAHGNTAAPRSKTSHSARSDVAAVTSYPAVPASPILGGCAAATVAEETGDHLKKYPGGGSASAMPPVSAVSRLLKDATTTSACKGRISSLHLSYYTKDEEVHIAAAYAQSSKTVSAISPRVTGPHIGSTAAGARWSPAVDEDDAAANTTSLTNRCCLREKEVLRSPGYCSSPLEASSQQHEPKKKLLQQAGEQQQQPRQHLGRGSRSICDEPLRSQRHQLQHETPNTSPSCAGAAAAVPVRRPDGRQENRAPSSKKHRGMPPQKQRNPTCACLLPVCPSGGRMGSDSSCMALKRSDESVINKIRQMKTRKIMGCVSSEKAEEKLRIQEKNGGSSSSGSRSSGSSGSRSSSSSSSDTKREVRNRDVLLGGSIGGSRVEKAMKRSTGVYRTAEWARAGDGIRESISGDDINRSTIRSHTLLGSQQRQQDTDTAGEAALAESTSQRGAFLQLLRPVLMQLMPDPKERMSVVLKLGTLFNSAARLSFLCGSMRSSCWMKALGVAARSVVAVTASSPTTFPQKCVQIKLEEKAERIFTAEMGQQGQEEPRQGERQQQFHTDRGDAVASFVATYCKTDSGDTSHAYRSADAAGLLRESQEKKKALLLWDVAKENKQQQQQEQQQGGSKTPHQQQDGKTSHQQQQEGKTSHQQQEEARIPKQQQEARIPQQKQEARTPQQQQEARARTPQQQQEARARTPQQQQEARARTSQQQQEARARIPQQQQEARATTSQQQQETEISRQQQKTETSQQQQQQKTETPQQQRKTETPQQHQEIKTPQRQQDIKTPLQQHETETQHKQQQQGGSETREQPLEKEGHTQRQTRCQLQQQRQTAHKVHSAEQQKCDGTKSKKSITLESSNSEEMRQQVKGEEKEEEPEESTVAAADMLQPTEKDFRVCIEGYWLGADSQRRLQEDAFLDDAIIDFFLQFIIRHIMTLEQREHFYIFNTFFFSSLRKSATHEAAHQHHTRWLKKEKRSLPLKSFIFIPINRKHLHWSLLLVVNPAAAIRVPHLPPKPQHGRRSNPQAAVTGPPPPALKGSLQLPVPPRALIAAAGQLKSGAENTQREKYGCVGQTSVRPINDVIALVQQQTPFSFDQQQKHHQARPTHIEQPLQLDVHQQQQQQQHHPTASAASVRLAYATDAGDVAALTTAEGLLPVMDGGISGGRAQSSSSAAAGISVATNPLFTDAVAVAALSGFHSPITAAAETAAGTPTATAATMNYPSYTNVSRAVASLQREVHAANASVNQSSVDCFAVRHAAANPAGAPAAAPGPASICSRCSLKKDETSCLHLLRTSVAPSNVSEGSSSGSLSPCHGGCVCHRQPQGQQQQQQPSMQLQQLHRITHPVLHLLPTAKRMSNEAIPEHIREMTSSASPHTSRPLDASCSSAGGTGAGSHLSDVWATRSNSAVGVAAADIAAASASLARAKSAAAATAAASAGIIPAASTAVSVAAAASTGGAASSEKGRVGPADSKMAIAALARKPNVRSTRLDATDVVVIDVEVVPDVASVSVASTAAATAPATTVAVTAATGAPGKSGPLTSAKSSAATPTTAAAAAKGVQDLSQPLRSAASTSRVFTDSGSSSSSSINSKGVMVREATATPVTPTGTAAQAAPITTAAGTRPTPIVATAAVAPASAFVAGGESSSLVPGKSAKAVALADTDKCSGSDIGMLVQDDVVRVPHRNPHSSRLCNSPSEDAVSDPAHYTAKERRGLSPQPEQQHTSSQQPSGRSLLSQEKQPWQHTEKQQQQHYLKEDFPQQAMLEFEAKCKELVAAGNSYCTSACCWKEVDPVTIPWQENGYDCGVFLIEFVLQLVLDPLYIFSLLAEKPSRGSSSSSSSSSTQTPCRASAVAASSFSSPAPISAAAAAAGNACGGSACCAAAVASIFPSGATCSSAEALSAHTAVAAAPVLTTLNETACSDCSRVRPGVAEYPSPAAHAAAIPLAAHHSATASPSLSTTAAEAGKPVRAAESAPLQRLPAAVAVGTDGDEAAVGSALGVNVTAPSRCCHTSATEESAREILTMSAKPRMCSSQDRAVHMSERLQRHPSGATASSSSGTMNAANSGMCVGGTRIDCKNCRQEGKIHGDIPRELTVVQSRMEAAAITESLRGKTSCGVVAEAPASAFSLSSSPSNRTVGKPTTTAGVLEAPAAAVGTPVDPAAKEPRRTRASASVYKDPGSVGATDAPAAATGASGSAFLQEEGEGRGMVAAPPTTRHAGRRVPTHAGPLWFNQRQVTHRRLQLLKMLQYMRKHPSWEEDSALIAVLRDMLLAPPRQAVASVESAATTAAAEQQQGAPQQPQ